MSDEESDILLPDRLTSKNITRHSSSEDEETEVCWKNNESSTSIEMWLVFHLFCIVSEIFFSQKYLLKLFS